MTVVLPLGQSLRHQSRPRKPRYQERRSLLRKDCRPWPGRLLHPHPRGQSLPLHSRNQRLSIVPHLQWNVAGVRPQLPLLILEIDVDVLPPIGGSEGIHQNGIEEHHLIEEEILRLSWWTGKVVAVLPLLGKVGEGPVGPRLPVARVPPLHPTYAAGSRSRAAHRLHPEREETHPPISPGADHPWLKSLSLHGQILTPRLREIGPTKEMPTSIDRFQEIVAIPNHPTVDPSL